MLPLKTVPIKEVEVMDGARIIWVSGIGINMLLSHLALNNWAVKVIIVSSGMSETSVIVADTDNDSKHPDLGRGNAVIPFSPAPLIKSIG